MLHIIEENYLDPKKAWMFKEKSMDVFNLNSN